MQARTIGFEIKKKILLQHFSEGKQASTRESVQTDPGNGSGAESLICGTSKGQVGRKQTLEAKHKQRRSSSECGDGRYIIYTLLGWLKECKAGEHVGEGVLGLTEHTGVFVITSLFLCILTSFTQANSDSSHWNQLQLWKTTSRLKIITNIDKLKHVKGWILEGNQQVTHNLLTGSLHNFSSLVVSSAAGFRIRTSRYLEKINKVDEAKH